MQIKILEISGVESIRQAAVMPYQSKAKGCKSEKECADIIACIVQGSEFNYNSQ